MDVLFQSCTKMEVEVLGVGWVGVCAAAGVPGSVADEAGGLVGTMAKTVKEYWVVLEMGI